MHLKCQKWRKGFSWVEKPDFSPLKEQKSLVLKFCNESFLGDVRELIYDLPPLHLCAIFSLSGSKEALSLFARECQKITQTWPHGRSALPALGGQRTGDGRTDGARRSRSSPVCAIGVGGPLLSPLLPFFYSTYVRRRFLSTGIAAFK